jgi:hypothetical protein
VVAVFATSVIWVAKQLRMSLFFTRALGRMMSSRRVVVWELRADERGAHTKGLSSFSKVIIDRCKMVLYCVNFW